MSKLKVGDSVRYLHHDCEADENHFEIGEIYTITRIEEEDFFLFFIIGNEDLHIYDDQVELVKKVKDTKLARKMYKNYKVEGEYLLIEEG
jgi:hypothetical protein